MLERRGVDTGHDGVLCVMHGWMDMYVIVVYVSMNILYSEAINPTTTCRLDYDGYLHVDEGLNLNYM